MSSSVLISGSSIARDLRAQAIHQLGSGGSLGSHQIILKDTDQYRRIHFAHEALNVTGEKAS